MTRIFNFAKIDFLRIRNFKWIALFPLLVVVIFLTQPDTSPLYILCYCIFAGIIFSTLPCAMERINSDDKRINVPVPMTLL